jgi:hypothetical protein
MSRDRSLFVQKVHTREKGQLGPLFHKCYFVLECFFPWRKNIPTEKCFHKEVTLCNAVLHYSTKKQKTHITLYRLRIHFILFCKTEETSYCLEKQKFHQRLRCPRYYVAGTLKIPFALCPAMDDVLGTVPERPQEM